MLGGNIPASPSPAYDQPPKIAPELSSCLGRLESRRFITEGPRDVFGFTHPFYRAAAETILAIGTAACRQRAMRVLRRALFCASPLTSRAAAKNLDWFFRQNSERPEAAKEILALAIEGLNSIFLASRDVCLKFLIQHLSELPADQVLDLPHWVASAVRMSLDDMAWLQGEAWLPEERGPSGRYRATVDPLQVRREVDAVESGTIFRPERASDLLLMLTGCPSELSSRCAQRLLGFDEAVIRAETARVWLTAPRSNDSAVLSVIFGDLHPAVALGALDGIIAGWPKLAGSRRRKLLGEICAMASSTVSAAGLIHTLLVFNRVEHTGENPPWEVFGQVFPVVLQSLPANVPFDDARLFGVMEASIKALASSNAVRICSEWLELLKRQISAGRLPSDHALGVAEILIAATDGKPMLRRDMVQQLLELKSTGALMSFIRDFVNAWEHLVSHERRAVVGLLKADRPDSRWLRAVAVTRSAVPPEIQRVVFGSNEYLRCPADQLLNEMPSHLLAAAVAVQCGSPQPLWYLRIHHPGGKFAEVLRAIQEIPEHPLFEVAFDDVTSDDRLAELVHRLGPACPERFLRLLILASTRKNNFFPDAWSALLELIPEQRKEACFNMMAEVAPAIIDHLEDLRHWLIAEKYQGELLYRLASDVKALALVHRFKKLPSATRTCGAKADFADRLLELLRRDPPRVHGTFSDIQNFVSVS